MIKLQIEIEEQLRHLIKGHQARLGLRYALLLPSLLVHYSLGYHKDDAWFGDTSEVLSLLLKGSHDNIIKHFSECTAECNSLRISIGKADLIKASISKRVLPEDLEMYEVTCDFFRTGDWRPFFTWRVMIEASGALNGGVTTGTEFGYHRCR